MGRVCHGSSLYRTEIKMYLYNCKSLYDEFVMGRVCYVPSRSEVTRTNITLIVISGSDSKVNNNN